MWLWSHRCQLDVCSWHDKVLRRKSWNKAPSLGTFFWFRGGTITITMFLPSIERSIAILPHLFVVIGHQAAVTLAHCQGQGMCNPKWQGAAPDLMTPLILLQGNISVQASQLLIAKKQLSDAMNNLHGWGEVSPRLTELLKLLVLFIIVTIATCMEEEQVKVELKEGHEGQIPKHLVVQSDDTTSFSKNHGVHMMAGWLVASRYLGSVTLNYLVVGHTHEDVGCIPGRASSSAAKVIVQQHFWCCQCP